MSLFPKPPSPPSPPSLLPNKHHHRTRQTPRHDSPPHPRHQRPTHHLQDTTRETPYGLKWFIRPVRVRRPGDNKQGPNENTDRHLSELERGVPAKGGPVEFPPCDLPGVPQDLPDAVEQPTSVKNGASSLGLMHDAGIGDDTAPGQGRRVLGEVDGVLLWYARVVHEIGRSIAARHSGQAWSTRLERVDVLMASWKR